MGYSTQMSNQGKTVQVTYHKDNGPNTPSDDVFIVVNAEEAEKWGANPGSLPLVEVVETFTVYRGGHGQPEQVGKEDLARIFGTSNEDEVVTQILAGGKMAGKTFQVDARNLAGDKQQTSA